MRRWRVCGDVVVVMEERWPRTRTRTRSNERKGEENQVVRTVSDEMPARGSRWLLTASVATVIPSKGIRRMRRRPFYTRPLLFATDIPYAKSFFYRQQRRCSNRWRIAYQCLSTVVSGRPERHSLYNWSVNIDAGYKHFCRNWILKLHNYSLININAYDRY